MTDQGLHKILELSENIARHRGFLGQRETDDLNQNKADFTKLRRVIVHDLAKREGTFGLHRAQLESALLKVASKEGIPQDAFEFAQTELLAHLAKEHRRGYLTRMLVRWGPPTLAVFAAIAWYSLKFLPELNWLIP